MIQLKETNYNISIVLPQKLLLSSQHIHCYDLIYLELLALASLIMTSAAFSDIYIKMSQIPNHP